MKRDRLLYIDNLKGLLIITVVLGHVLKGLEGKYSGEDIGIIILLERIIYSFHMPVFIGISGYLWERFDQKNVQVIEFVKKRVISLGIPYVICSVLYWTIKLLMNPFLQIKMPASAILNIWRTPIEHLWYLYTLFFLVIIAELLFKMIDNAILWFAVTVIISLVCNNFDYLVLMWIPFYIFGILFARYNILHRKYVEITSVLIGFASIIMYVCFELWIYRMIAGLGMFIVLMRFFEKYINTETPLTDFGRDSMPIYIMHVVFVGAIRILLVKCGIDNLWIHVILGFAISWIVVWYGYKLIISKIPVFDFAFYPQKYIRCRKVEGNSK